MQRTVAVYVKSFPLTLSHDTNPFSQAEHDTASRPILVTTSSAVVEKVNACLQKRLATLPTRDTAAVAVKNGFAVVCKVCVSQPETGSGGVSSSKISDHNWWIETSNLKLHCMLLRANRVSHSFYRRCSRRPSRYCEGTITN